MRSYPLLIILTFLLSPWMSMAQNNDSYCGTPDNHQWFDQYIQNPDKYAVPMPEEPIYIPITVHVLGTDEGNGYFLKRQVYDAFCRLNEDFSATNMQFFMKDDINYINRTSWYDHEEFSAGVQMMRANNVNGTVNCYIVSNPAGNCGYYAPGGDAVALNKGCMAPNDHTWAHELGHYFSLPHTFRGWEGTDYEPSIPTINYASQNRRGIENVDRSGCTSRADRFCDTDPDYLSYRWPCDNQGFSIVTQTDLNGETFKADGTLFMSYSLDNCPSRFSTQQVNAMVANFNSQRRDLLNNETYPGAVTDSPEAIFPVDGEAAEADNAVLTWSAIENANYYHIQASRLPNLGGLLIADEVVTDTTYQLPELTIGRTYYWRVRAFNKFEFCTNPSERNSFVAAELTSSKNLNDASDITIAPNPLNLTAPRLTISGIEWNEDSRWTLFDIQGRMVDTGRDLSGDIIFQNDLQSGIYSLIIENGEKRYLKKLIITQ